MSNITNSLERNAAMTKKEAKLASNAVKDLLLQNPDGWREVVRMVLQEVLEAEMNDALDAVMGLRLELVGGVAVPQSDGE